MSRQAVAQVEKQDRPVAGVAELLYETQAKLEALNRALAEFERRQGALNSICRDLTAMSDRETLLASATSFLKHEFSDSARIILTDDISELPPMPPIATPIRVGDQTFGHIVVPPNVYASLSNLDRETLKTFAGFLAVALGNIRRLEEARELACVDPLTGVLNRRRLFEVGSQQVSRTRSTGLIVFDIDHLKTINDAFGHLCGDALIKSVADRAKECVRKSDFLARYGGDEFVILLPNTNIECVHEIAERVRASIESAEVEWRGQPVRTTASVGFACVDGDINLYDLLGRADDALYAAKRAGRNLVRS